MTTSAHEKAQRGLTLLKEAVVDLISSSPRALRHSEIVAALGLETDFEGSGRNYLSYSVLGVLVAEKAVRYHGDRMKRVFYVRDDQLANPLSGART